MSRIAGFVLPGAPVPANPSGGPGDRANHLLAAMAHQESDAPVISTLAGATFGVIGGKPFEKNGHLIVADVHLTQRDQLRRKLLDEKPADETLSDTQLLLEAFLHWGRDCVHHITGSFVFVVWDGNSLFMARDHLGIKPIYYTETPRCELVFASEARAIARDVDAEVNQARVADALVFPLEHVDKVSTPYDGVFRLPPGTLLTADQRGISIRQYWDGGNIDRLQLSDDAWVDKFRETMLNVLEDHRSANESLAVALSGGVDSATIACMAAGHGIPVHAYSTVLDDACLDTRHIQLAVSRCALDTTQVTLSSMAGETSSLLEQLSSLQEPFDTHMLQMMILNLAAKKAGHTCLLDGVEGELIYSLPGSYPTMLYREGRIREGVREAWRATRLTGQHPLTALYGSVRGLGAPPFLRNLKSRLRRLLVGQPSELEDSWISVKFAEDTNVEQRLAEMRARNHGGHDDMFEAHRRSVTHPAIAAALERYDRVAALTGIESRHPLLDLRLVELMLAAPDYMKVRHGWSKYLLRLSGAPDVPAEISWRTDKEENAWRFSEELGRIEGHTMRRFLERNRTTLEGYVKPEVLTTEDASLPEVFGFCHWLIDQQQVSAP